MDHLTQVIEQRSQQRNIQAIGYQKPMLPAAIPTRTNFVPQIAAPLQNVDDTLLKSIPDNRLIKM